MRKLGLAFGGGGGRGAYQLGVWRALIETGLDKQVQALSGTSIGAFNAVLFVQGDYDKAIQIWSDELDKKILILQNSLKKKKKLSSFSFSGLSSMASRLNKQGIFSREGILQTMKDHLNLEKLSHSALPITIAAIDSVKNKLNYFKLNGKTAEDIQKILVATSAIPFIFPPEVIDGHEFIDGGIPGIGDACPIRPLAEAGCDTVIALPLDRITGINPKEFPYTRIIEIIPSNSHWGFISAIDGLLDFSPKAASQRMALGYTDAMRILWEKNLTDIIAFEAESPKKTSKKREK
ncbi:MAG: patatin-like phospholipase family protein [Brevinema sp.]